MTVQCKNQQFRAQFCSSKNGFHKLTSNNFSVMKFNAKMLAETQGNIL